MHNVSYQVFRNYFHAFNYMHTMHNVYQIIQMALSKFITIVFINFNIILVHK